MKCSDRACRTVMTVEADGAFACPACGHVVRLAEFTGGSGLTTVSRPMVPPPVRRKRSDASPLLASLDLAIETSARGALA